MKSVFKPGDAVTYGVIDGILLGIYDGDRAFIMSDANRSSFKTGSQLEDEVGRPRWNVLLYFVREHFNYPKNLNSILEQKRFAVLLLSDLKKSDGKTRKYKDLLNRRRMHLSMAYSYMRSNRSDEAIHRVCKRIEDTQLEIELLEDRARRYLRGEIL